MDFPSNRNVLRGEVPFAIWMESCSRAQVPRAVAIPVLVGAIIDSKFEVAGTRVIGLGGSYENHGDLNIHKIILL